LTGGGFPTGGSPLFAGGAERGGGARCRLLGSVTADSIRSATQRPAQRLSAMVSTMCSGGSRVTPRRKRPDLDPHLPPTPLIAARAPTRAYMMFRTNDYQIPTKHTPPPFFFPTQPEVGKIPGKHLTCVGILQPPVVFHMKNPKSSGVTRPHAYELQRRQV
jgi:hypothetical protein